jgi:hypothetical protein
VASNGTTKPETRAARWRRDDFDPGPTGVALYRMYDAGGDLLYVGISRSLVERWRTHRREAAWWHEPDGPYPFDQAEFFSPRTCRRCHCVRA